MEVVHGSLVVCFAFQTRIGWCSSGRVHSDKEEQELRQIRCSMRFFSQLFIARLWLAKLQPGSVNRVGAGIPKDFMGAPMGSNARTHKSKEPSLLRVCWVMFVPMDFIMSQRPARYIFKYCASMACCPSCQPVERCASSNYSAEDESVEIPPEMLRNVHRAIPRVRRTVYRKLKVTK